MHFAEKLDLCASLISLHYADIFSYKFSMYILKCKLVLKVLKLSLYCSCSGNSSTGKL